MGLVPGPRVGDHLLEPLLRLPAELVADAVARRVTGREIPAHEEPRRPGDPAALVAASDRIRDELGWVPEKGLEDMIADAWAWSQANPDGYR